MYSVFCIPQPSPSSLQEMEGTQEEGIADGHALERASRSGLLSSVIIMDGPRSDPSPKNAF